MLEKIGLPSKPSLRGSNWVVDASHCQGCSSQFTFINRKHHCRRCGGLFCNSCTQHRMTLRGQGDSSVRICEPCKHLEEAARFEMRHGRRSRASRGGVEPTIMNEDENLRQILGEGNKQSFPSAQESDSTSAVSDIKKTERSASCSDTLESSTKISGKISRNHSVDMLGHSTNELGSASPEELRKQAVEEKKRYKVLKGEGKAEEALKAFKRVKELERQAGALDLLARKNRRKASIKCEVKKGKDDLNEYGTKDHKLSPPPGKEEDYVVDELKELGWSDADIRDGGKKATGASLEGELIALMGKNNAVKGAHGIDQTEVVALKRKALMLKREGKLSEAKEELKRAKVLEKQLEEQEFLVDAEDSEDDVISSLIRSMDVDATAENDTKLGFDFNYNGVSDDFNVENFDVTDEDMNDPELVSALSALGWDEECHTPNVGFPQSVDVDREAMLSEIQSLKTMAVNKKRAGDASEAMQLLKKAKLLEKDLESYTSDGRDVIAEDDSTACEHVLKSKSVIQRELLGLKKKALALRREGRLDEAEEELKKAKTLEQQLEDGQVMDQDMDDPAYLAILKNLGWEDDNTDRKLENLDSQMPLPARTGSSGRSKAEIQSELLGLKRKALALRRQGDVESAEQQLRMARMLESEMAEMEGSKKEETAESSVKDSGQKVEESQARGSSAPEEIMVHKRKAVALKREGKLEEAREELRQAKLLENIPEESDSQPSDVFDDTAMKPLSVRERFKLQQESLSHKRQALKLRREGRMEEAEAEFESAKALEAQLESSPGTAKASGDRGEAGDDLGVENLLDPELMASLKALGLDKSEPEPVGVDPSSEVHGMERVKAEECIRAEKMKAIQLKRSGKQAEALAALKQAKLLEKKLNP